MLVTRKLIDAIKISDVNVSISIVVIKIYMTINLKGTVSTNRLFTNNYIGTHHHLYDT